MDFTLSNGAALSGLHQSQLNEHSLALKSQNLQDMEDKKLREQTDQFESLLLKIMLEMAIKNEDGLYPKQPGSDIYHSMFIDQLSQELAGSFGYSELLFNFLKDQQNQGRIQKPTPKAYSEAQSIQNALDSELASESRLDIQG